MAIFLKFHAERYWCDELLPAASSYLERCVVDEHVDAAILIHRLLHHLQAHRLRLQVAADQDRLAALVFNDLLRVLRMCSTPRSK